MIDHRSARRPPADALLALIADYVLNEKITSRTAYETANYCLLDSLACAFQAVNVAACNKLLGPVVDGAELENGVPVPGTGYHLDPVKAAFDIGTLVRWLDFNDTWLAAEWGHPSDNLGAILSVTDYCCRNRNQDYTVHDVLTSMIKAYEIQGLLALDNSFNEVGLDHVILVRIASTAVVTALLGGDRNAIINALSNAWIDGGALRTYRHAPNTGSRKSWAAGDATSRAVRLALMTLQGEMGYESALTAKNWGFNDVLFRGKDISIHRKPESYVMENILFKIAYPAEFHAQTAVEAAITLHPQVRDRLEDIDSINLDTQQAACRIIDKTGPLDNPADRDHCLQYMVAVALLFGKLDAGDYEDNIAKDARIDLLRDKMLVNEDPVFTHNYYDPDKRSIGNAVQVRFKDGSETRRIAIEYPLGHRFRRQEAIPLLKEKFLNSVAMCFSGERKKHISSMFDTSQKLHNMPVSDFMSSIAQP